MRRRRRAEAGIEGEDAVDDQVEPIVLRDALGHSDLGTTSIYLKPEQRALVAQMAKMRRRG